MVLSSREERLKYLRERQKLNASYERAVDAEERNKELDIREVRAPEKSVEDQLSDINSSKQELLVKLKTILHPEEATRFLLNLEDDEVTLLNKFWGSFVKDTEGIEKIDATYARKLFDNFARKLMAREENTDLDALSDSILQIALRKGISREDVMPLVSKYLEENDANALTKLYRELLIRTPEMKMIEQGPHPDREILTEEVMPEVTREHLEENIRETKEKRDYELNELIELEKDGIFHTTKDVVSSAKHGTNAWNRLYAARLKRFRKAEKELRKSYITANLMYEAPPEVEQFLEKGLKPIKIPPSPSGSTAPELVTPAITPQVDLEEGPEENLEEKEDFEEKSQLQPSGQFPLSPGSLYFLARATKHELEETVREIAEKRDIMERKGSFPNIGNIEVKKKNVYYDGKRFNLDNLPGEVGLKKFLAYLGGYEGPEPITSILNRFKKTEKFTELEKRRRREEEEEAIRRIPYEKPIDDMKLMEDREREEERRRKETEKSAIRELEIEADKALLAHRQIEAEKNELEREATAVFVNVLKKKIKKNNLILLPKEEERVIEVILEDRPEEFLRALEAKKNSLLSRIVDLQTEQRRKMLHLDEVDKKISKLEGKMSQKGKLTRSQKEELLFEKKSKYHTEEELKTINKRVAESISENDRTTHNLKNYAKLVERLEDREDRSIDDFEVTNKDRHERIKRGLEDAKNSYERALQELEKHDEFLDSELSVTPKKKKRIPGPTPHKSASSRKKEKKQKKTPGSASKKKRKEKNVIQLRSRDVARELFPEEDLTEEEKEREYRRELALIEAERQAERDAELKEAELKEEPSGSGLKYKTTDMYVPFGKYKLNLKNLDLGIFDLHTKGGRTTTRLAKMPISSLLTKLVIKLIRAQDFDQDLYKLLNEHERNYFNQALKIARVEIPLPSVISAGAINDMRDDKINRYQILRGELMAGNNSPAILKELRGIIFYLVENRFMDQKHGHRLMYDIDSVER